ncbi:hypothetical protein CRG98_032039 [Punica granatum]|uniref:Uncharacterized protein n=1 Tax=Punica granatum TaxID=22663 RepID=A0A2I0IU92_PUNGR|nr:hypothetical protein CRG98_032039 [Punica granatum]
MVSGARAGTGCLDTRGRARGRAVTSARMLRRVTSGASRVLVKGTGAGDERWRARWRALVCSVMSASAIGDGCW